MFKDEWIWSALIPAVLFVLLWGFMHYVNVYVTRGPEAQRLLREDQQRQGLPTMTPF